MPTHYMGLSRMKKILYNYLKDRQEDIDSINYKNKEYGSQQTFDYNKFDGNESINVTVNDDSGIYYRFKLKVNTIANCNKYIDFQEIKCRELANGELKTTCIYKGNAYYSEGIDYISGDEKLHCEFSTYSDNDLDLTNKNSRNH